MITVLFFGRMGDVAGQRRMEVAMTDGLQLLTLRDDLLPSVQGVKMSVNREVVVEDRLLRDGDEVAFFSVFSGG